MPLLTIRNLAIGYDSRSIVEKLNFVVNSADHLCSAGKNGSGKTTLKKTLLHLRNPAAGQILYGDGLSQNNIGYLPRQTIVFAHFRESEAVK